MQEVRQTTKQRFETTALVLLAAGQSSRFEDGDKLLAPLWGRPLIAYSAGLLNKVAVAARVAVVGPGHLKRTSLLQAAGWLVLVNDQANTGMASSLATGVREVASIEGVEAALIMLADMPNVPDSHLIELHDALTPNRLAVMSQVGHALQPPAIFRRTLFDQLSRVVGDKGARQLFESLDCKGSVSLDPSFGTDVDTNADLSKLEFQLTSGK
jgi:xanthine dehydrogenase accessory factor